MQLRPQIGTALLVYTTLFLGAVAYLVWAALAGSGQFELAGIFIVILGLPWSLIVSVLVLAIGSSSAWLLAIGCLVGCAANAWLAHRLDQRLARRPQ